jgi:hypothetical protein
MNELEMMNIPHRCFPPIGAPPPPVPLHLLECSGDEKKMEQEKEQRRKVMFVMYPYTTGT